MIWVVAIIVIAIGLALWYQIFKKKDGLTSRVNAITNIRRSGTGYVLMIEHGCSALDAASVTNGLTRTFEKAKCAGYSKALEFTDYTIAILKGEPDSEGNPALRTSNNGYQGSGFDKGDGTMLVAGYAIAEECLIVIPEHGSDKSEHLARILEYESEHCVLWANDRVKYEQTKIHGVGTGHPIIRDCA